MWGASDVYPQHMFSCRNKKNIYLILCLDLCSIHFPYLICTIFTRTIMINILFYLFYNLNKSILLPLVWLKTAEWVENRWKLIWHCISGCLIEVPTFCLSVYFESCNSLKYCRPRSDAAELETICMKCQILFSEKSKKSIINLSAAEFAQRVIKVNGIKAINVGIL